MFSKEKDINKFHKIYIDQLHKVLMDIDNKVLDKIKNKIIDKIKNQKNIFVAKWRICCNLKSLCL